MNQIEFAIGVILAGSSGDPEVLVSRHYEICPDRSASGVECGYPGGSNSNPIRSFTALRNRCVRPRYRPSFAQRCVPEGTESAPTRHRPDGNVVRSPAKVMRCERRHFAVLCCLLHDAPNYFGTESVPQILSALLIDRSRVPVTIPAAPVQASIPALTQSGTG